MSAGPSTEQEISSLAANLAPLVILLIFIVISLVWTAWFSWGVDPLYSSLHHFLTFFPLVLLALLTYVAYEKLRQDEEGDDHRAPTQRGTPIPRMTTADGAFRYLIASMLAFAAAIGLYIVLVFFL